MVFVLLLSRTFPDLPAHSISHHPPVPFAPFSFGNIPLRHCRGRFSSASAAAASIVADLSCCSTLLSVLVTNFTGT
ncbi:hypothetical protein SDJN02_00614, partial [Cucurbita argyrosperma subsp. argyrosperma]